MRCEKKKLVRNIMKDAEHDQRFVYESKWLKTGVLKQKNDLLKMIMEC